MHGCGDDAKVKEVAKGGNITKQKGRGSATVGKDLACHG